MKQFTETKIPGVHIVELFRAGDDRGKFVKTFHQSTMAQNGLDGDFRESFYSVSQKGVVRGMHFQLPPHDHQKLVYCNRGRLHDVLLDIRRGSPAYGKSVSVELSGENHRAVYVPRGIAHGFEVLEDNTMMTYLTGTEHAPDHDAGIKFDSFGHKWSVSDPILSDRDQKFPALNDFESPFEFQK